MRIKLVAVAVAACCLLGCGEPKLPTPVAVGPDSGWVRAPVKFTARNSDGSLAGPVAIYDWGDGAGSINQIHTYSAPGLYQVICRACEFPELGPIRYSDSSEPHPIRILEDTLVFPDSIVHTIPIGPGHNVRGCVLPDGSRLYLARTQADSVSVVETQTNSVIAVVPAPNSPVSCVASHSGEYVYVTGLASGTLCVIRTSDNTVVHTIAAGRLNCLALHPNDSLLYMGYTDNNHVAVMRIDNDSLLAQVDVEAEPSCIVVKPGGEYIYVVSEDGKCVTVVRTADNAVVTSKKFGTGPTDCLFSPTGDTVSVTFPSDGDLALLRSSDLSLLSHTSYDTMEFMFGRYVAGLPGGPCLYVTAASENGSRVAVVRRSDNYLLRNLYFGGSGMGIAGPAIPLPDRSRVYVPTSKGVFVLGLRPGR